MDNNKKHIINRLTSKQEGKSGFTTPKDYFENVENDFFAKLSEKSLPKQTGFKTPKNYLENLEDAILAKVNPPKKEVKIISLSDRLRKITPVAAAASVLFFIGINYFSNEATVVNWDDITTVDVNNWYESTSIDNTELALVYEDTNVDEDVFLSSSVDNIDIEDYFNAVDTSTIINEIQ